MHHRYLKTKNARPAIRRITGIMLILLLAVWAISPGFGQSTPAADESQRIEGLARQWMQVRNQANTPQVQNYFRNLEIKNCQTLPRISQQPVRYGLPQGLPAGIPAKTRSGFGLTQLLEYRFEQLPLFVASYEQPDEDAPLVRHVLLYTGQRPPYRRLTVPFEIAAAEVSPAGSSWPALLNLLEGGHGSGTLSHIYSVRPDGTLQECLTLELWQDSLTSFVDLDGDGKTWILHATLAYFPDELRHSIGPAEDIGDYRLYRAAIYRWQSKLPGRQREGSLQCAGVKYYWQVPPFLESGTGLEAGWKKVYALREEWIRTANARLTPAQQAGFAKIEAWRNPPAEKAIVPAEPLDLAAARPAGIATRLRQTVPGTGGGKQRFGLAGLCRLALDGEIFFTASYRTAEKLSLPVLFLKAGPACIRLDVPGESTAGKTFQFVKLGPAVPPLVMASPPPGQTGDTELFTFTAGPSLQKILSLDRLWNEQHWLTDFDEDGVLEIVQFHVPEAPAGLGRMLEAQGLATYFLTVPRLVIYQWMHDKFAKAAVKYYRKDEELPEGLIKTALAESQHQKESCESRATPPEKR